VSRLYAAPFFVRWESMALAPEVPLNPFPCSIKAPPGHPGCLRVFGSMEALREWYPDVADADVIVILTDDGGE